jgi:hypothetical protein
MARRWRSSSPGLPAMTVWTIPPRPPCRSGNSSPPSAVAAPSRPGSSCPWNSA